MTSDDFDREENKNVNLEKLVESGRYLYCSLVTPDPCDDYVFSEPAAPRQATPEDLSMICTAFNKNGRSIDRTAAALKVSSLDVYRLLVRAREFMLLGGKTNSSQAA